MSMVRALLRNVAVAPKHPGEILRDLNNALAQENPNCLFVTAIFASFHPPTGALQIACAGHPPALLLRSDGSVQRLTKPVGPLLGFETIEVPLPVVELELEPNDTLLLYTDGLTEAPSLTMEMFGLERLEECFRAGGDLACCAERLRAAVHQFTNLPQLEDDITLALMRGKYGV
jgi:serine phosphatase RsbU (regulator of sigma subunit)